MRTCTEELTVGDRVELAPHTDLWARGARYGTVVKVGTKFVHVKLDRILSAAPLRFHPENLTYTGKADCPTCGAPYRPHLGYRVHMQAGCKGWS